MHTHTDIYGRKTHNAQTRFIEKGETTVSESSSIPSSGLKRKGKGSSIRGRKGEALGKHGAGKDRRTETGEVRSGQGRREGGQVRSQDPAVCVKGDRRTVGDGGCERRGGCLQEKSRCSG